MVRISKWRNFKDKLAITQPRNEHNQYYLALDSTFFAANFNKTEARPTPMLKTEANLSRPKPRPRTIFFCLEVSLAQVAESFSTVAVSCVRFRQRQMRRSSAAVSTSLVSAAVNLWTRWSQHWSLCWRGNSLRGWRSHLLNRGQARACRYPRSQRDIIHAFPWCYRSFFV